jgi:ribosomal protein S18 acetylase RimI-like enzyme
MTDVPCVVRRVSGSDSMEVFRRIARLHAQRIHGGVLPLLGETFLGTLYREIAKSKHGTVHEAVDHERLLGFIVGTPDISRCALGFTLGGYLRLTAILAGRIWHPEIRRKFFDALMYPVRKPPSPKGNLPVQDKHRAELLAIAVSADAEGRGVGRAMVDAFEDTLPGKIGAYFVTTNADDMNSNAFYRALGFEKAGQKRHHDLLVQIYTKQVRDDNQAL